MIPKIIHYCWFGEKPKPELVQNCINSWRINCPKYQIREWNENSYDISKNEYMHKAYKAKKWGFVPDYARLDIIYEYGGIYFDTDVELIKPIDDLLINKAFFGMEQSGRIACGLGFGAEPHNDLINKMRNIYEDIDFINDDEYLSENTDPKIMTDFFVSLGWNKKNEVQLFEDAIIFPTDYFSPKDITTGIERITHNTYSIHHYDGSWAPQEVREYNKYKWKVFSKYGMILGILPWSHYVIKKFGIKEFFKKIKNHI